MKKEFIRLEAPKLSLETLLNQLHIDPDDETYDIAVSMCREAEAVARPAAVFRALPVEETAEGVLLAGVLLKEDFVREKLSGCDTVYPYIATCGPEAEEWSLEFEDFYEQYVADAIKLQLVGLARTALYERVCGYLGEGEHLSSLNPGSLQEWPITGQVPLFAMLDGGGREIGVTLTDSMLMVPSKSVSGIFFATPDHYENCQLCPRLDCPNRRAPFIGD